MKEKIIKRRRGAAIIETPKGVLVCARKDSDFMIPGGGANFLESRKRATIREVYEELGLKVKTIKYAFNYVGPVHKNKSGKLQQNFAKAFIVTTEGNACANNEINRIAYWKPGSKIKLMEAAKIVLDKYEKRKREKV